MLPTTFALRNPRLLGVAAEPRSPSFRSFFPSPYLFVSRLSANVICTKGVSLTAAAPSFQLIKIDNGNSYGWASGGAVSSPGSELVEARMNVNAI